MPANWGLIVRSWTAAGASKCPLMHSQKTVVVRLGDQIYIIHLLGMIRTLKSTRVADLGQTLREGTSLLLSLSICSVKKKAGFSLLNKSLWRKKGGKLAKSEEVNLKWGGGKRMVAYSIVTL